MRSDSARSPGWGWLWKEETPARVRECVSAILAREATVFRALKCEVKAAIRPVQLEDGTVSHGQTPSLGHAGARYASHA